MASKNNASENPDLRLGLVMLALATAVAPLIAYSQTPSATLYNQLAALFGWGAALLFLSDEVRRFRLDAIAAALLLLLAAPFVAIWCCDLPSSLALESVAMIGAALMVYLCAAGLHDQARLRAFDWFCWGLLLAGLLSLGVSVIQVFVPNWADSNFIARSGLPGRAIGNMRQPNHLASLMMWACVAVTYLGDQKRFGRFSAWLWPVLLFGFVFTIVLSASRTGLIGVVVLAVWGLIDGRLSRATRMTLVCSLLMVGIAWWGMEQWAYAGHVFGAQTRLESEGAGSDTRKAILVNALELVKRNPWFGVGWGEFNLAWTMTPFPNRPIAFFDHTHNVLMQLAVELGLPVTLLIIALLSWGLWRALAATLNSRGNEAVMRSSALMMVLAIGLHSMLEYPLWYAYFLLPAAFAIGLGAKVDDEARNHRKAGAPALAVAGALMLAGTVYAAWEYQRVVSIYAPSAGDAPLAQRIAVGQHTVFFSSLADYAGATSLPEGPESLAATRRTSHNLIDARLMKEWAEHLHEAGDDDRARYVVQRLKEFRSNEGKAWLAECEKLEDKPVEQRPFQCEPPKREYDWREMR